MAFGINSLNVQRDAGGEGIKDGTRWDGLDVRANGSKSRAQGHFLEEDIRGSGGKQREGDGGCGGSGAKGNRFAALVAKGGSGDDGRIKLDHGESEREWGKLESKGAQGTHLNSNRSHATKAGQVKIVTTS